MHPCVVLKGGSLQVLNVAAVFEFGMVRGVSGCSPWRNLCMESISARNFLKKILGVPLESGLCMYVCSLKIKTVRGLLHAAVKTSRGGVFLLVRGPHGSAGCPSIRACCRESSLKWTVHAIPFLSFCVIEKSIPMVRLCSLALLEKFWFFFPKNPLQKSDSKCLLRPDLCATLLFLDAVGCFSTMQPDVGKPEHSLYLQWKTDQ